VAGRAASTALDRTGFRPASLDAVNFLLADVRGALGPYLNVFLVTQQHWSQTEVGWVTTASGLLGLAVQTPIGAAIDATRAKRGAIVLALAVLAAGAAVIFALPTFWPVLVANALIHMVGDVFGPAVAALTLGLYARAQLARRMHADAHHREPLPAPVGLRPRPRDAPACRRALPGRAQQCALAVRHEPVRPEGGAGAALVRAGPGSAHADALQRRR